MSTYADILSSHAQKIDLADRGVGYVFALSVEPL